MKKSVLALGLILSILTISGVLAYIDVNSLPSTGTAGNQINPDQLPVMNTSAGNQINPDQLPEVGAGTTTTTAPEGLSTAAWIGIIAVLVILIAVVVIIAIKVLSKPVQNKK